MKKAISFELQSNNIAIITIDLPDSKVNLLSRDTMLELDQCIEEAKSKNAKGIIVCSGKEDNFGAGADVQQIRALQNEPPEHCYEASKMGKEVFAKLASLNSLAAVHGTCLGGFTELALACKYRIASPDKKTQIGVPEIQLGFVPGWGATVRLPRLIGAEQAFKLISTGKNVDAKKAYKLGVVDQIVEKDNFIAEANEILSGKEPKRASVPIDKSLRRFFIDKTPIGQALFAKMAKGAVYAATKGKYPAPPEALKVVLKAISTDEDKLDSVFDKESQAFAKLATTPVSSNLVNIFFAQTESKKTNFDTKNSEKPKVIGVLGAGVMGAGIAQAAAYKGFEVYLKDIDQAALDKGVQTVKGLFDNLVEKGRMSESEAKEKFALLKGTLSYNDMSNCDIVIEAVLEKLSVKEAVRAELEKVITKPFIFASNTSSLSISEMAKGSRHEDKVVGVHFFNPVHKMPLVEIVRGDKTSSETEALAQEFAMKLGKTTVITGDAPGFVVNRILAPYMREAIVMAQDGVPMADIEKAALSFGMPMGPFALLDEVGLDIASHVIKTLHQGLGERMVPPAVMAEIDNLKLLGRKGKKGIYLYNEKGDRQFVKEKKKKRYLFNPDVEAIMAKHSKGLKKTAGEIQDRLFLAMAAEAARCLEEKVVTAPSQLDLAMIFGIGFPPFVGGICRYMDSMGVALAYQKLSYLAQVAGLNYEPCKLLEEMAMQRKSFYQ
ncbi:MAG: enoyl-CoA hydratase/isomerase family protein [Candidatus Melainabacteria bacterium]|nr:MAG: enoyl-CoA hydratase/isomerase family protein [Candidatus Melainabacteria bacterium]